MSHDDLYHPQSLPPQSLPPQSLPPQSLPPMPLSPYTIPPQSPQSLTPVSMATMPLGTPARPDERAGGPRRQPAWVVFAIVGLVAIILGISTGLLLNRSSSGGGGTGPSDTVLRFYQAIRDARAQAALSELAAPPSDTSLITDQVLRVAQQTAPMTELSVPPTRSTVVQVSFRQGGEPVTERVSVTAVANGYKIITSVNGGGIQVTAIQRPGVTLFIADQQVKQSSVLLLPGAYPVRSSSKHLSYGQGNLVVKRIDDAGNVTELTPQITADGAAAVKRATLDSLTACTKVKSFQPPSCPFGYAVPNATTADPAQSTWSLVGDPTADLKLTLGTDPRRVDMQTNLVARMMVTPTAQPVDIRVNGARATVDLTQDKPVVTWSR